MTESLTVDTARLEQAAAALQVKILPDPPAPITAPGTDSMTAAINETMPLIESPVLDGLPTARAVLAQTASSVATAAAIYADTDELLGRPLADHEFATTHDGVATVSEGPAPDLGVELADAGDSEPPTDEVEPGKPRDFSGTAGAGGYLSRPLNQVATTTNSITQSISPGVQRAAQGEPHANALDNQIDNPPEEPADGAAQGADTSESVPAHLGAPRAGEQATADAVEPVNTTSGNVG